MTNLGGFRHETIFKPLGMSDTAFFVPPEKLDRFAPCYSIDEGASKGFKLQDVVAESPYRVPRRHLTSGGGGLVSTLSDYTKFMLMLQHQGQQPRGPRVLSRKTVEFMMINHLEPGVTIPAGFLHAHKGCGFGIGGSVVLDPGRNALIGSKGQWSWGGAANTYMNLDMEEDLGFLLITQVMPSFKLCQWRRDLQCLVEACLVDPPRS